MAVCIYFPVELAQSRVAQLCNSRTHCRHHFPGELLEGERQLVQVPDNMAELLPLLAGLRPQAHAMEALHKLSLVQRATVVLVVPREGFHEHHGVTVSEISCTALLLPLDCGCPWGLALLCTPLQSIPIHGLDCAHPTGGFRGCHGLGLLKPFAVGRAAHPCKDAGHRGWLLPLLRPVILRGAKAAATIAAAPGGAGGRRFGRMLVLPVRGCYLL
mmetsp:Transcript_88247/g.257941  ORF Transcript_88247/g.257941 Transcript_88247/m.257941 type:complete len:215 (+) Transcript_88247:1615-2259(+)